MSGAALLTQLMGSSSEEFVWSHRGAVGDHSAAIRQGYQQLIRITL